MVFMSMILMYLYSKINNHGHIIVYLYVDDKLIFSTNLDVVNVIRSYLSTCFDMKNLGKTNVILSIKITKTNERV